MEQLIAIAALALVLGDAAPPSVAQPSSSPLPQVVAGTERLGWDQLAADAAELGQLSYAVYLDGTTVIPLEDASCDASPRPSGFRCSAPLPQLLPGPHALELVAKAFGVESSRSSQLSIVVSGVAPRAMSLKPSVWPQERSGRPTIVYGFITADGARLAVETYAGDLESPAAMAFLPDGRLFVAERNSQIRVFGKQAVFAQPAMTLSDALDRGEVGSFVDLALHPAFERNHLVYVLFVAHAPGTMPTYRVARFRELNGALGERVVLVDGIRASSRRNATIRFGPDRRLYLAVEDLTPQSVAQDLARWNGKVLRLNDDGTVPRDNPLPSPVFSSGHAAPVGLAWHPETGDLWETEQGLVNAPDELNLVTPNGDYGWPDARLEMSRNAPHVRVSLGTAVAPVGATFYAGALIPQFHNNLFFASLGYRCLYRVRFDPANPQRVIATERLLENFFGDIGGPVDGPDGGLYFFGTSGAGPTANHADSQIFRIVPAP